MNRFEYTAPATLEEAASQLSDRWGETEVMAGGTDLLTCLKQNIVAPKRVVSLKNVESLSGIQQDSEGKVLRIGATTTLRDLRRNEAVNRHFPALAQAVDYIGSPQIVNAGTVAGDLCQRPRCWYFRNGHGLLARKDGQSLPVNGDNRLHAIFGHRNSVYFVSASTLGPVLMALGASVRVAGPGDASRTLALADFFKTPSSDEERETALKANEIVRSIDVPLSGLKNATYEVRHRHGLDWPYVTASVAFQKSGGVVSDARVILGHVAPTPWRTRQAEAVLNESMINLTVASNAGNAAVEGASPLSGNSYKLQLVKTAVKRAAMNAAGLGMEG